MTQTINSEIEECGEITFLKLQDLYNLEADTDAESILEFTQRLRGQYDALVDAGQLEFESSVEFDIPTLPLNCDADSQNALMSAHQSDDDLQDCLSFQHWVLLELAQACEDCRDKFITLIDDNTIILQAAELRIVDQLDNLYLLEDPEVSPGTLE